jgi:hypothetical protein
VTLVPGNALTLAGGKQTAKGAAQSTPDVKVDYIGQFGPLPTWDTITLAETDATSQEADNVRVGFSNKGQSEHYVRPDEHHYFAHWLLGSTVTTGAGPYTHVTTPTADGSAPYVTLYRATDASVEVTEMVDCQLSMIEWTGAQGGALSMLCEWVGLSAILGATDPVKAVSTQVPLVYPQVTATWGGVHDGSVQSFKITANRNRKAWIGDTGTTAFDIVPGLLSVTGEVVLLFQNDQEFRNFIGGTTAATAPSTTIPSKPLSIIAAIDANTSVQWDLASAQLVDYQRQHNTDGSPLLATIQVKSKKSATLGNVLTVTTKNTIATP